MRRTREKGYWLKKSERFGNGDAARSRAGVLRAHENIAHVTVEREGTEHVVSYSVAKWYFEELEKAGIRL